MHINVISGLRLHKDMAPLTHACKGTPNLLASRGIATLSVSVTRIAVHNYKLILLIYEIITWLI